VYFVVFEATHERLDTLSIERTRAKKKKTQFGFGNPSAWTGSQVWSATCGVWRGAQKDLRELNLRELKSTNTI